MTGNEHTIGQVVDAVSLNEKKELLWPERFSPSDELALRTHRAISWIGRAERETGDEDAAFIFHWIAFNAAYAQDIQADELGERSRVREYFKQLIRLDTDGRIFNAVWVMFSDSIRILLSNRYIFQPFWHFHNGVPGYENWESRFQGSSRLVNRSLGSSDTETVLSILFDRLYVLRNQIVHGGATWNSSLSRDQVRGGRRIMSVLVPLFVDTMLDNPSEQWGPPYYPIVN